MSQYIVKGMTDLAIEYDGKKPDFILGQGQTDIWVVTAEELVARWRYENGEEWCTLFKEFDVWWMTRRNEEKRDTSNMLKPEDMNVVDDAVAHFLMEREFLDA